MSYKQEYIGTALALLSAAMWGMFPVVVHRGVQSLPSLTFAAISFLLASFGSFVYAWTQGALFEIKKKEAYQALVIITFCIVIIPYILFFIGAKQTSGVNTTMLLLSEIIFTLLFTHFIGEQTTGLKLLGAFGVFFGALFILYNGAFYLNVGDLLIIASTVTFPIGNFYAKRALNVMSPAMILFVRFFLGGLFILVFSLVVERGVDYGEIFVGHWPLFLFNGLVLLGLGKIVWYEALKRLDISKAISLIMTFPVFSLGALVWFFGERISVWQWLGVVIMMAGVYFSVRRVSVDPRKTRYAPS